MDEGLNCFYRDFIQLFSEFSQTWLWLAQCSLEVCQLVAGLNFQILVNNGVDHGPAINPALDQLSERTKSTFQLEGVY